MAYVKDNPFMEGSSGTIAKKMNFRVKKNKTVIGKNPGARTGKPTDEQLAVQDRFTDAVLYAQYAMKDPQLKAQYQRAAKGGQTAYNAAFRDAATSPVIHEINISGYKGAVGNVIAIKARDVIPPKTVSVVILSAAGEELESGEAVPHQTDIRLCIYTVTAANAALPGTRIVVTATDHPGNSTEKETVVA